MNSLKSAQVAFTAIFSPKVAKRYEIEDDKLIKKPADRAFRSIERLSEGVPQTVLDAMQIAGVLWAGPEWLNIRPTEPSKAQLSTMLERSFEAQIKRLEAYRERSGQNV
jgi:hypothetical protein